MRCVSFAATRVSIVRWIYDPDHSLPPGMYVDVPHLDCLLIAAPITLEGLDHLILKPKQLDGITAVYLKFGPRLHGIYSGQSGIQCCLVKLVVEPWSQCLH